MYCDNAVRKWRRKKEKMAGKKGKKKKTGEKRRKDSRKLEDVHLN